MYRERKRINALEIVDYLIHNSQIPGTSQANPLFVTRGQITILQDSQIAGTSTNMDIPLIMDHNSENRNHNHEHRVANMPTDNSTYSSRTRDNTAHKLFQKLFI
ncbi:hypothetical protein TNIN_408451 [Trichonephila inaurata madagascariensis]|uniref:Uncharacterized protein n=1 Tax=Trichonephila inaurata madagascariensis TaxID=2747483 RepID=A0A8X7C7J0_9ARAC|nr:hypothetical protein TNIN_408451 [Trichonephila inaurata madagascariensis]